MQEWQLCWYLFSSYVPWSIFLTSFLACFWVTFWNKLMILCRIIQQVNANCLMLEWRLFFFIFLIISPGPFFLLLQLLENLVFVEFPWFLFASIYHCDKIKSWLDFGDHDLTFKVTGGFRWQILVPTISFESLDGFSSSLHMYIIMTSLRAD